MLKIIQSDAWPSIWISTWISMKGPDAQDFLHRLSTANIKGLQPGRGARSCFLTANGRIRSYHTLWCLAPGEYALELNPGKNGEWKKELLQLIEQLTFAEKFTLTEWEGISSLVLTGDEASAIAGGLASLETRELAPNLRACHLGNIDLGVDLVEISGAPEAVANWRASNVPAAVESLTAEQVESLRLEQVRPRVDAELMLAASAANPLELGLLEALPRGKGCYPGQEVIERTISIGAPAKRLALIEGTGMTTVGASVLANGAAVGTITSVIAGGGASGELGFRALALIRKSHASEGIDVVLESAAEKARGVVRKLSPLPSDSD